MAGTSRAAPAEPDALIRALSAHPLEMANLLEALHRRVDDADALLDLMGRVCREAVRLLEGVGWAGVTTKFAGPPLTVAHTDTRVLVVDILQYAAADSPCLRAIRGADLVTASTADLAARWPGLARTAAVLGMHSMVAVPLLLGKDPVGALNLYYPGGSAAAPDRDVLTVLTFYAGRALADFAVGGPAPAAGEALRCAAVDSVTVDQAVGVLMQLHGFTADYAVAVLLDQAKDWGRTVADQAAHILGTNRPPG